MYSLLNVFAGYQIDSFFGGSVDACKKESATRSIYQLKMFNYLL